MDMKNNGSVVTNRKSVKGFTLVELIVVMAIIAVLAGVLNLATQGFIRNARRETANDNARILFTGFQNILTQCEIKQDNSAVSPTHANDTTLTNIVISLKIYDGYVQIYDIDSAAETFGSEYKMEKLKYVDVTSGSNACKLPNEVMGIVDNTFEGEAKIYIDYENYEVKSVVYKPMTDSNRNTTINNFTDADLDTYDSWYLGYDDGPAQRQDFEDNGILYGVYPYQGFYATT